MARSTILAALAFLVGMGSAFADGHGGEAKFSGFIDAQYQFNRGGIDFADNQSAAATSNTFTLNQAALYISKEMKGASLFIDLPFSDSRNTNDNNFTFAQGQAQAYLKNKYDSGLSWSLGQFDTKYGFEKKDTKDLMFAQTGVVAAVLPKTHLGLKVGYAVAGVDLALLISNQNGEAAGNSATNSEEMGVQAMWKNDQFRARAGVLLNKFKGNQTVVTTEEAETETLIDVGFGATFGDIMVDLAYSTISNKGGDSKVSATEDLDNVNAILAQVGYKMGDCGVALRYENVTGDKTALAAELGVTVTANDSKREKITLAYNHKMNADLTMKAEVSTNSAEVSATSGSESWTEGRIAGVMTF